MLNSSKGDVEPQAAAPSRRWWNRWYVPYVVLTISPAIALPLSVILLNTVPHCLVDERQYRLRDAEIVLAPLLTDLLPFLWLASGSSRVRLGAVIAGTLGSVRFAVPQALLLLENNPAEPHLLGPPEPPGPCTDYPIGTLFFAALVYVIPVVWFVTALAAVLITARTRSSPH